MASVKTAVSIEESLFDEAEALAHEMDISRSRLFMMALEQFIRRERSQHLVEQINAAVDDGDAADPEEGALRAAARGRHRELVEGEW